MDIRKCEINDIGEVYELICELEETVFDYKAFEIAFMHKINDNKNCYMVGVEDNKIIAFLSLNIDYQIHHAGKVATIEELIVTAEHRSKSAGRRLAENAIKYAKDHECAVIELNSSVLRERAHQFYIKNGFEMSSYKFVVKL